MARKVKEPPKVLQNIVDDLNVKTQDDIKTMDGRVFELDPDVILAHPDHKWEPIPEHKFQSLLESVNEIGFTDAAQVEPVPGEEGKYYLLAGYNRLRVAKELNVQLPVTLKKEDANSRSVMNDSNLLGRKEEDISLKEWVSVIGQYADDFSVGYGNKQKETGKRLDDKIAERIGMNRNKVAAYLKLRQLIPELLEKANEGQMKFYTAFHLAFLSDESQRVVDEVLNENNCVVLRDHARELKALSKNGKVELSKDQVEGIILAPREVGSTFVSISMTPSEFAKYVTEEITSEERAKQILGEAMELWKNAHANV